MLLANCLFLRYQQSTSFYATSKVLIINIFCLLKQIDLSTKEEDSS